MSPASTPPTPPATGLPAALIRDCFRPHAGRYALGFAMLAATNLLALSIPMLLKYAVDALQRSDARRVALLAAAIAGFALAQALVRTASRLAILGASRHVAYELRGRLFSHLQRLPLSSYGHRPVGDLISRAVNDMLLVRSFFGPGLLNLVNTSMVYVTALAMMLTTDARLTLYALAPAPLFMLAVNRLSKRIFARTMEAQEQLSTITSRAQENISAISLIKTCAREEAESASFDRLSERYLRTSLALARARGAMVPLMGAMAAAGTLVVIGLGGREVIAGRLSLGDFVAFNAYLAYLVWPTFAFGWILNTFQRGAAAMQRIGELLAEPVEQREMPAAESASRLRGDIEIRNLSYTHPGGPPGARHLEAIDVSVPRGGTLGILGTVGAGKSTLTGMLPRVVDPPPGKVLIDGRDVMEIPLARLREDIAMVPQESILFSRSLRDNVGLGRPGASKPELEAAVTGSGLRRDLEQLPHGLDTLVGERGVTLSGGQRQRAAIARALLRDAPILILDDALSSLDAEVEREVVEELRRQKGRRTMILVSHRIAGISWTDQILVLSDGRIIERGTHAQLLAAGGLYARIARRQSLAAQLEEI